MSAQQDVAIVEDGLASGAGRAEAGVAALGLDLMCLCQHGCGLFFAEKFLGFIGSEERDDIIDAANVGFKLSQQSFGGSLLTGLIDSGEVGFGGFLESAVAAGGRDDSAHLLEEFFFCHSINHPFCLCSDTISIRSNISFPR